LPQEASEEALMKKLNFYRLRNMDKLTPERRSANMASIRSKGMKPELTVRSLVHALGYRFRLHRKDLPGKPDLVFPSRKADELRKEWRRL
jgi:hypothetical protein